MVRKIYVFTLLILTFFSFQNKLFAETIDNTIIKNTQFSPAIITISVKDKNTGKTLYQKNDKTLVHPASTLKIITSSAALDYLGSSYNFKTSLYKHGQTVYLKLSADPLFTTEDAQKLTDQYALKNPKPIKNLAVDDTIIDKISYGTGWQWDDNASYFFPQISPYIINKNLFPIKATIIDSQTVKLDTSIGYKERLSNQLKPAAHTKIQVKRNIFNPNQPILIEGTIHENQIISIPAKDPEKMYMQILLNSLFRNNIAILNRTIEYAKVPRFSAQESVISHSITEILKSINTNSDNLAAEVLLKHAAAIKTESTGTTENGITLIKDFYKNTDEIQIVDASGVSMNNYVTADFMTNALIKISQNKNFEIIHNSMADNYNGTFKGRLPQLAGKIKVKTGTLANTSAVVGYIKTKSNKDLVFAIMLDNLPLNVKTKTFENEIIQSIYDSY